MLCRTERRLSTTAIWSGMSGVIIAEVTQPSLGVGYELGRALDMHKKILCLPDPPSEKSSCSEGPMTGPCSRCETTMRRRWRASWKST
ncbi:hypothetical protein J4Q44_G00007840 [Coregonus suidteri]|uniref:Uncharacterized protein n=1 Tax=Coregonus suidteri TaxID=861788 RepID=A0AAN8R832_9TELE